MSIDGLLLLLTALLGATLSRVSLCAVAAVQQCVTRRDWAGPQRLVIAASAAGIILPACSAWAPLHGGLPGGLPVAAPLLAGAVVLGVGALLNGACYLGSVLYLGNGNMNFLFTLLGLGLGAWAAGLLRFAPLTAASASAALPEAVRWAGIAAFTMMVVLVLAGRARRGAALWPLLAGLFAGLVYARHPGWSYGQVIDALAGADWRGMSWLANLAALALFAGAITASCYGGRWHWQPPSVVGALRCLCGGILMALGAKLIPGGTDMLLLWSIPGLALYGAVAYATMLATLVALFSGAEIWRRRTRNALKLEA